MQAVELTAKEVLLELIQKQIEKYPLTIDTDQLAELLNIKDKSQIYHQLRKDKNAYPSGQKLPGMGWRFNRDVILTWLYAKEQ